jgi:hypothetical protein
MADKQTSPQRAPKYALYREVSAAADSLPETQVTLGMNMGELQRALIQVIPSASANPAVAVLWWSAEAGKFIQENVALTKSGAGAGVAYEFTVEANGRIMFVAVTGGITTGDTVKICVAGFNATAQ